MMKLEQLTALCERLDRSGVWHCENERDNAIRAFNETFPDLEFDVDPEFQSSPGQWYAPFRVRSREKAKI